MSETQDDTTTRTAIGQYGRLVVARCTGCRSTTKKRADVDPDGKQSFKHVCHVCKKSTYWNVIEYVDGQDDPDGVDRGDGAITDGGEPTLTVDGSGTQLLVAIEPVDGLKLSVAVEPGVSREEITDALSFADDEIAHVRSLDPLHTDSKDPIPTENHDAEIETVADGGEVDRGDGPITDGGERTTLDELDDDRDIYHAGRNTGKNVKMHLDESCAFLDTANYVYTTRAGKLHGDRVVCSLCDGEFTRGGDNGDATEFKSMVSDLDPEDLGLEPIGERTGSGSV